MSPLRNIDLPGRDYALRKHRSFRARFRVALTKMENQKTCSRSPTCLSCRHQFPFDFKRSTISLLRRPKLNKNFPLRKQQAELLLDQNFYVTNDNKDCVAVKGTTGLSSLWQHHLTKLPMVALETAESIIAEYPMPRALIEVGHCFGIVSYVLTAFHSFPGVRQ